MADYKFDAEGNIKGGLLEGLNLSLDPIRRATLDAYKADPANVLFGEPPVDPYAAGGKLEGLKFGADKKLYGVLGYSGDPEAPNPILAEIQGWQFDTSTLPAATPGAFYDAAILPSRGGHLIQVSSDGSPVGYARQRSQMATEAQAPTPGTGSARTEAIGDPRKTNPGPHA